MITKFSNFNLQELRLKKIIPSDYEFLYKLLKQREKKVNISHKKMPTYSQHLKFIQSTPYFAWYVIKLKTENIGSIYLSYQNEIGVFLEKKSQNKGFGKKAIKLLIKKHPKDRYLANINPKNISSEIFFKNNGFKLIQHTYELIPIKK